VRLVLVAVLSLIAWTTAGADRGGADSTSGAGELAAHVAGHALGRAPIALVATTRDRSGSGGNARAQRLVLLVTVLVSGAFALWSPAAAGRRRHDGLPVWSGWFADPGRLRGPPAN